MENSRQKTRIIVECAVMIAISCVLSLFPKFKFLPFGGSITICSMLPIVLVSYRRGLKWGFLAAFVFAIFQTITGFEAAGITALSIIGIAFFDYFAAFTVLGIGGIFRGRLGSTGRELVSGTALALALRFMCHVISGAIFFGEYAGWFFDQCGSFGEGVLSKFSGVGLYIVYSLIYNATYMIPEIIITCIVAALISKYALYKAE